MIDPTLLYDFCSLFSGYSAAFGTYDPRELGKSNGKQKVKQHTVKEKLTKDTYKRHLEGVKPLGVVMLDKGERVSFAAIDIDVYPLNLKDLSIKLMKWKLPLLVCSSKSKGAHIFAFFETPQNPDNVINALKIVASALGHPSAEVFPSQKLERGVPLVILSIYHFITIPHQLVNVGTKARISTFQVSSIV